MPLDDGSSEGGGRRPSRNVLGERLELCSLTPMTGFFRNGCCDTGLSDRGSHTVWDYGFPGLKPGDRWCLCAPRWQEALAAGMAPRVVLRATHEGALDYCALADLKRHAVDLS